MRLVAVSINGILDLKNFFPLSMELKTVYGIVLDIVTYSKKTINLVDAYDGVVVGSDWNQNREIVTAFKAAGKATILVQSEGMFLNREQWYAGRVPQADVACLWGEEHAAIFRDRGYKGRMVVTGPPRLDIYHDYRPPLSRHEIFEKLGIAQDDRPYVLFLGQFFPEGEFGPALIDVQRRLTDFACRLPETHLALVKSHPQEDIGKYFSRHDIVAENGSANTFVIDSGGHRESVELSALLAHAAAVVGFSSTALVEAVLLGKPAFVFDGGLPSPIADGRTARLPVVGDVPSLLEALGTPPDATAVADFMARYLPGRLDGRYTAQAAAAVATALRGRKPALPARCDTLSAVGINRAIVQAYADAAAISLLAPKDDFLTRISDSSRRFLSDEMRARLDGDYYQKLHQDNTGYKINNWLVEELDAMALEPSWAVVELGCGNGAFLRRAAGRVASVTGLDWARSPQLDDLPENAAFHQVDILNGTPPTGDVACSADVLEHFDPPAADEVIAKLVRCAPRQYHVIACYSDGHSHLTIANPGLWLGIFKRHSDRFRLSDVRFRRGDPNQAVCVIRNY